METAWRVRRVFVSTLTGRGEVRYSQNGTFQAKAFNLYENTRVFDQDPLIGLLFGFIARMRASCSMVTRTRLSELLTYIDDSDGGVCVLHRIPGMEKARLSGCRNTDVGGENPFTDRGEPS